MSGIITLTREGNSRIEIKQSVFIGKAVPVSSQDEATAFVSAQRALYPDARHTVYVWKVSGEMNMQKYSDDGEPQGTAALPVLSIIEHAGLTNVACCVTRYFGGILLGKGGLVRAYTESAKLALSDGRPVSMTEGSLTGIKVSYQMSDKVLYELKNLPCEIKDTSYLQDVEFLIAADSCNTETVTKRITDLTGGTSLFEDKGKIMIKGDGVLL
ncbi:MAG: YigZ family protein [Saccharofermentans sp.]|nr:YigZ family protein [Saccharofermentans sp.]